jgi:hypothetical protein
MRGAISLILLVSSAFVSCSVNPSVKTSDFVPLDIGGARGHGYWFSYDASRRGAMLIAKEDNSGTERHVTGAYMCAEPAPDVALSTAFNMLNDLKVGAAGTVDGVTGKGSVDFENNARKEIVTKVVELASRTQTIQFLREAMYRLCEQQMNGSIDKQDVKALYRAVVDTSTTLAEASLIDTLSSKSDKPFAAQLLDVFVRGELEKHRLATEERRAQLHQDTLAALAKHQDSDDYEAQKQRFDRLFESLESEYRHLQRQRETNHPDTPETAKIPPTSPQQSDR